MSDAPRLDADILELISGARVALAVSGGSDSLALLRLLADQSEADLSVVTVDHGLRVVAHEIEQVAGYCALLGVPHEVLRVNVPSSGNLQAQAREARYQALQGYCAANGIHYLALGHTQDDHFETFLLNAMRGSGVDGLAGMASIYEAGGVVYLRPLLQLRRQELRDYLTAQGWQWADDPSNENLQFDRVKLRQWLAQGEGLGLAFDGLARTQSNMARAAGYLQGELARAAGEIVEFAPLEIEAWIARKDLLALDEEIALRLLAKLCQFYGGSVYKPRLSSLRSLLEAFRDEKGGRTLEKTAFYWHGSKLRVCAEPAHLPKACADRVWSRFTYLGAWDQGDEMGPLGALASDFDAWREWGLSARAAEGLPVIFRGGAPVLMDWESYQFECFKDFLHQS